MEINKPEITGCYQIKNNTVTDCEGNPVDYNEISKLTEFFQRLRTGVLAGTISLFANKKKEQTLENEVNNKETDFDNNASNKILKPIDSGFNEELIEPMNKINTKNKIIPSHLTEREIKNLENAGFLSDSKVGHEKAIINEQHPSNLTKPVFQKNSNYNNWDNVGSFEIPRYPVYAYGESSNHGTGKEGDIQRIKQNDEISKYWNE